ncbi:HAD hydrolase family protein [bacterium]|nr:HAD hydrolase family protein [bacterium]
MIEIQIPGSDNINIKHLVFDFNGTLAIDGKLIEGVRERLLKLSDFVKIHVITADTFGMARKELKSVPCSLKILSSDTQAEEKAKFVKSLEKQNVCAIGNGFNDNEMVRSAELGIAVIQEEGAAKATILNSDIICKSIIDAMEILLNPKRITASLRR